MAISDLSTVNAGLNALCAVLLASGFVCIRRRRVEAHRRFMTSAFVTSCLFLVSYLVYHSQVGSVRFQGQGWIRPVYFTILTTHTVLAGVIVPLAIITLRRGLRRDIRRHRRIARWTLPIWFYVSITGVVIYVLLYHVYARG
jgi:putative membrane protein